MCTCPFASVFRLTLICLWRVCQLVEVVFIFELGLFMVAKNLNTGLVEVAPPLVGGHLVASSSSLFTVLLISHNHAALSLTLVVRWICETHLIGYWRPSIFTFYPIILLLPFLSLLIIVVALKCLFSLFS